MGISSVGHVTFEGGCASLNAYQSNLRIVIVFLFSFTLPRDVCVKNKIIKK